MTLADSAARLLTNVLQWAITPDDDAVPERVAEMCPVEGSENRR